MTAFPHCPGVAVRGIPLSVAMVTAVALVFVLGVAPLLSVVVLMVGAAASFGRVELVLRGRFLEVVGAQVLLGVVVPVERLLFPQVTHTDQRQQKEQEQCPTHSSTHYGAKITLREGFECGGAQEDMPLFIH